MTKKSKRSGWRSKNGTIDSYFGSWKGYMGRKWVTRQSETGDRLFIWQEKGPPSLILVVNITELLKNWQVGQMIEDFESCLVIN
jgi:hypothetical protein